MDIKLGHFKPLFLLESVYGICTVSLETLEQSTVKVVYSSFFIIAYIVEQFISESDRADQALLVVCGRRFLLTLPLYSLIKTLVDYKTKISEALNLEAIEETLNWHGFAVPGKNWSQAMSIGIVVLNVGYQITFMSYLVLGFQAHLPITRYITTFQWCGTELTQGLGLLIFLVKVAMIQDAITKGFSDVIQSHQEILTSLNRGSDSRGRRVAKPQTEVNRKLALLSKLQGDLQLTEGNIRNGYRVQIIWYRLVMEIVTPLLCFIYLRNNTVSGTQQFLGTMSVLFLAILYAIEKILRKKNSALNSLTSRYDVAFHLPQVKHQILANIHRSQVGFSCGFFDVDYSILTAILENSLFVATSVIGSVQNTD